jgi:hypothetical protein
MKVECNLFGMTAMSLNLRRVIADELRALGASDVRIDENGRGRHPKVIGQFGARVIAVSAPRGQPRGDRGGIRDVYRAETRRRVRRFLARK